MSTGEDSDQFHKRLNTTSKNKDNQPKSVQDVMDFDKEFADFVDTYNTSVEDQGLPLWEWRSF